MPQTCKTPPVGGGASRDHRGGWSRSLPNPVALQAQILIAAHHMCPELTVMLAAFAFGGHSQ